MNNLLCSILFCLTAFNLVNADCSTSPSVPNATITKQDHCGDMTIRCDKGFIMEQVTECFDGEWKYQEPFCKPLECNYTFTNGIYVDVDYFDPNPNLNVNQTECDKRCNDDTKCSNSILFGGECILYPAPLISLSLDTDLDQCIEKCTEMEECLMFSHWGGSFQLCYMYNVTLSNLPEVFGVYNNDGNTVAEKFCL